MSRIRANQITNQAADGAPTVQHGLIIAGVSTFTGSVSIGGTLTYEDVTNIDSIGIITARSGVDVDDFVSVGSNIHLGNAGVITATTFKGDGDFVELDVDGHTNLDNVSIVGIVTISAGVNNEGLRITGQNNNAVIFTSPSINSSAGYRLNHHPATNVLRVDTTDQNGTFSGTVASFSSAGLDMADNIKLRLGTSQDLTLYHYGNDAYIDNATGSILFRQGGSEKVRIPSAGGIELKADGKGIQFPTPQTPSNSDGNRVGISSEMRYYETGTFVPGLSSTVLNSLQNPVFTDASYARRIGRYVRVGHLVFCNVSIKMASSITFATGAHTGIAPVSIVGVTPFKYSYAGRYAASGEPDYNPCNIWYNGSGLTDDTLYATMQRHFPGQTHIQITKPSSGGVQNHASTNYGEVFPADSHVVVSYTYAIDLDNADY